MIAAKSKAGTRWPGRTQEVSTYGLTAVTLGDVLKDELDKVVEATKENRSEIIRRALEQYFDGLPELRNRRREDREKARDRQFGFVFYRILDDFNSVMREFAYPDALPLPVGQFSALEDALDRARDWLGSQIPNELNYQLPREIGLALSDIHRGFHRLFLEADKPEWQREGVQRWRKKLEHDKGAAHGEVK